MRLRYYGDPVLRKRAQEVGEINDEIRAVVKDLHALRREHPGGGIAAPQGGVSLRIFLARLDDWGPDGFLVEGELLVFINPKIVRYSEDTWLSDEGCLSLPGLRIPVERPKAITVEALGLDGNPFKLELEGLPARIVMHENDHLNGVLTIDRTSGKLRKKIEPQLRSLKKRYQSAG